MSGRFLTLLALAGLLPVASFARTIDGYDADAIKTALKGKKIVIQNGCLEEPRLRDDIAKTYASHFPGIPEDDSAFRSKVTKAFYEGLAKKARDRIEFDSTACRTGAKSKMVTDIDGHSAMLDGGRINGSKAYLALGIFHFESPSYVEQELARRTSDGMGTTPFAIYARIPFGIYDTQERLLVYYGDVKAAAVDDYIVIKLVTREHWEASARKLGEQIGAIIAKLPGK